MVPGPDASYTGVWFLSSSVLLARLLAFCLSCFLRSFLSSSAPYFLPSSWGAVIVDARVPGGRRNLEDMLRVPWHVAIFDEAHKLKNRSAKIYEACCQLPTKLRYGLTGTAMQV